MATPSTENKPIKKATTKPAKPAPLAKPAKPSAASKGGAQTAASPSTKTSRAVTFTAEEIAIAVARQLITSPMSELFKETLNKEVSVAPGEPEPLDTTKRIGALKGLYVVPDDIDTPFSSEIEDMFYGKDR